MVHRKSCYTLTFKTIGARDRRNLYEENLNSRYLYEAVHRFHQPLPFEEEPCDCDCDDHEEQQKLEYLQRGKATRRAQSQPRPTSSRPSTEPRPPPRGGSSDWPPLKHQTDKGIGTGNVSKACTFCGCDFFQFKSPDYHKSQGMFDTTYRDHYNLVPDAGGKVAGQESYSDSRLQGMDQHTSNSTRKVQNNRPYKTRFVEGTNHSKKDNRRTSTENKEEGIRGVFKCHPILREYDLLPATMKPYRDAPDGSPSWNSQGDRVPESERYRRSGSGLMLRNTKHCGVTTHGRQGRLSASTGNLATEQLASSANIRRVNSYGWRVTNTRDSGPRGRPAARTGSGGSFSQVLRYHARGATGPSGVLSSATPAMQWRCPACDRTATFRS